MQCVHGMIGIMDLATAVLEYYFTRADELSNEKRFHLANRIVAWNGDMRALQLVESCRDWLVPNPLNDQAVAQLLEQTNRHATSSTSHIIGYSLRRPYFETYPQLLGIEAELFRLRHLQTLYNIGATDSFLRRHSIISLKELERQLIADPSAMRLLSTWAINYIYLLHRIVLKEEGGIDIQALYNLGDGYDLKNDEQIRLFIYLYTHCIIAESNFYTRDLPQTNIAEYRNMITRLEALLANRVPQTSLDTKLEFLVCCRIVNYETGLAQKIYEECAASISPKGTFIVDTHNAFKDNQNKKSFEASEHRNVLFAMSVLPRS
jgi:hypothetical protein